MTHLFRMAAILGASAFLLLVARTVVLGGFVTLDDFALRPRDDDAATQLWANRDRSYAHWSTCGSAGCHVELYDLWAVAAHGSVSCEDCHGPAYAHAQDPDVRLESDTSRELCELCHAQLVARPSNFPQIGPDEHYPESSCISCHFPHAPGPAAAVTHAPEGDCRSCHDPVTARPASVMPINHVNRTNEDCMDCHEAQ